MSLRNLLLGAAVATLIPGAAMAGGFIVSLESELPGIQNSTSGFDFVGIENFDARATADQQNFTTNFGGSAFTGTYGPTDILNADQYGGAGGVGKYAATFNNVGYTLNLSTALPGGVKYFGFWLSALDAGNTVTFFSGNRQLFTFNAGDAKTFIDGLPNASNYYGNPNSNFAGNNSHEPYAFLNFYAKGNVSFDRVVFAENPMVGGYESDNHTVGQWNKISGTVIAAGGAVPEPASWAMLIAGFGMVGFAARRRNTARRFVAA